MLQREINQILLKLVGEMYIIKQIEARLKEIAHSSSEFKKKLSDVAELVRNQLTWIGANSNFPTNMPHKTVGGIKMELETLNFGCKSAVRLNTSIDKNL